MASWLTELTQPHSEDLEEKEIEEEKEHKERILDVQSIKVYLSLLKSQRNFSSTSLCIFFLLSISRFFFPEIQKSITQESQSVMECF